MGSTVFLWKTGDGIIWQSGFKDHGFGLMCVRGQSVFVSESLTGRGSLRLSIGPA